MLPRFRRGVTLTNTLLRGFDEFACWRFGASACIATGPTEVLRSGPQFLSALPSTAQAVNFSAAEVGKLLSAAAHLKRNPASPLRPELTRLAIVLLFTTGMRRGELLKLTFGDYDRQEATLHIRETKFYKSRLLPINGEIADEIERYLRVRTRRRPGQVQDLLCGGPWPRSPGCRFSTSIFRAASSPCGWSSNLFLTRNTSATSSRDALTPLVSRPGRLAGHDANRVEQGPG